MLFQTSEDSKHIDTDTRGNPIMTEKTLRYYLEKQSISLFPPPTSLYLSSKNFTKIANIDKITTQLESLWLNHNSIAKIQGLENLSELQCLYLNHNVIEKIQNINHLLNLKILNLSYNKIQNVSNLQSCVQLHTLDLSNNFLNNQASIKNISMSLSLQTLDLSHNQLQCSEQTFGQILNLKGLLCLYLKSTPLNRGFKNYRKRLIGQLNLLKFLDDRPVQQQDHRLAEAWLKGGIQLERSQRARLLEEKQQNTKKSQQEIGIKAQQEKAKRIEGIQQRRHQLIEILTELQMKEIKTQQQEKEIKQLKKKIQEMKNPKPKSFLASIKNDHIKIMNTKTEAEQQEIIDQYFSNQKRQIEERKNKENNMKNINERQEEEKVMKDIDELLKKEDNIESSIKLKWNRKYEPLLQALLERQRFDFKEVQPSFNMIISDINKKMMRIHQRFEVRELEMIWTQIEIRKRKERSQ